MKITPAHAMPTPPPWVAVNTGWGQSIIRPADAREDEEIVVASVPRGGLLYRHIDQGAANADLIRAAPDLLAACGAALEALEALDLGDATHLGAARERLFAAVRGAGMVVEESRLMRKDKAS